MAVISMNFKQAFNARMRIGVEITFPEHFMQYEFSSLNLHLIMLWYRFYHNFGLNDNGCLCFILYYVNIKKGIPWFYVDFYRRFTIVLL